MKKYFFEPELDMVKFRNEDLITTSDPGVEQELGGNTDGGPSGNEGGFDDDMV